jgi:DNA-binding transcriptional MerR regulator
MSSSLKEKVMTSREVAKAIGVTRKTLSVWRSNGYGPPYYELTKRTKLYATEDVIKWLERRKRRSTSDEGIDVPAPEWISSL